jgi:surface polysaccharide O-acyltransferase-like enzyme
MHVEPIKKYRNSSVEVFRILSMLLVLIVHFNGWLLGGMPDEFDSANISSFRIGQVVIQSFAVVCVNCFILISGYYGIKFKWSKIWNIFILLLFIKVPYYLWGVLKIK